jgi:trehalose 6-phosphate phosphatase
MSSRPTALQALAMKPASSGLVLDFDGVLSPIVTDPSSSAMPDQVAATLARLVGSLGLLAIMSGRPAKFLADRVRVPGVPLLGSYGIEQIRNGELLIDPDAVPWLGPVAEATRALGDLLATSPGIRIERKSVSVAVHWRQAPNREAAGNEVERIAAQVAANTGLQLEPGKLVQELRPPVKMNKGTAISALLDREKPVVIAYAGDDLGDLPALEAVKEKEHGYALVVDHGPETDQRLLRIADETFAGTDGFAAWLAALADAIDGSGNGG